VKRSEIARRRALSNAVASAPSLGAFTVALGQLGYDGAVQLCESRTPPPRVEYLWGVLGYTVDQLPGADEIRLLEIGAEIARRSMQRRKDRKPTPIRELIEGLCGLEDAKRAMCVLRSFGCQVEPVQAEVSAL